MPISQSFGCPIHEPAPLPFALEWEEAIFAFAAVLNEKIFDFQPDDNFVWRNMEGWAMGGWKGFLGEFSVESQAEDEEEEKARQNCFEHGGKRDIWVKWGL